MTKSRNSLDGKIINLRRGLAIYKVQASPYYRVRVWVPAQKKRIVKTTKATTRVEAVSIAEEYLAALGTRGYLDQVPSENTFAHFADKLLQIEKTRGDKGDISIRQASVTKGYLTNKTWGLLIRFHDRDVTKLTTRDFRNYLDWVQQQNSHLASATLNHIAGTFSKVMKLAEQDGKIDSVPDIPRVKRKDNPRAFFQFSPLVSKEHDEYKLLLSTAKEMANEEISVRGTPITDELYDFILFMTHSFLRPTESEVYVLTHRDISVADDHNSLIITIRKGKTGHRISHTMPAAVLVYERIKKRQEGWSQDDYLFLPSYKNRSHAKRIIQRQFNAVLERAGLKQGRYSSSVHTVYSLRHTAICMRLVLSKGKINIYTLAKNAGTSVDQIERFYARYLGLSPGMVENLQTFGGE